MVSLPGAASVENLLKRDDRAWVRKELYRPIMERAFRYGIPNRNLFTHKTEGQPKTENLYDSSGIISTNNFVNYMQSSVTPPFKKWCELQAGVAIPKEQKNEITETLELVTEAGFELINSSNYNVAVSEYYFELCVGTGVLLTLPTVDITNPINFICVPIEQVAIEEGPLGNVVAVHRCYPPMACVYIKEVWKDAQLPADLERTIRSNPFHEVTIKEICYESNGKYFYDIILKETKDRIVCRHLPFNPFIVTRLNKTSNEPYGRGPLIMASDELAMKNVLRECTIRSAQLNAFGLYTVTDSDTINPNTIELSPGSMIKVQRNNGPNGPSIAALPRSGDINWQQLLAQEIDYNIKSLLMNNRMPPEIGPVRSATEYAERANAGRIDKDAFFGRLMREQIQPTWQNLITIMEMQGIITLPPFLRKIDNYNVKIKVLSPIAKEQSYQDVENVIQAVGIVAQAGGPELANLAFKMDELGEWVADKLGVPVSLVRNEQERMMYLQQQQEAAMMQQLTQQEVL